MFTWCMEPLRSLHEVLAQMSPCCRAPYGICTALSGVRVGSMPVTITHRICAHDHEGNMGLGRQGSPGAGGVGVEARGTCSRTGGIRKTGFTWGCGRGS